jgi:D-threo-aldose 1-dehydrogenase
MFGRKHPINRGQREGGGMRDGASRLRELVPSMGFGAAQLGNLSFETSDEEAARAVDAAWAAGLRYFDTAPHYGLGLSEQRLGAALAGRPRDEVLVSTKVGRLLVPSPQTADRSDDQGFAVPAASVRVWDFSAAGIRKSLEASLERLGLDRVDIVYLHDPDDHWDEASGPGLETLAALRVEGLVGAIGVGMNQSAMPARFVREHDVDLVLLAGRYTLLDQSALDDLLPAAVERGVGIVAGGVYNSGLLADPRPADGATYDYAPAPAGLIDRVRQLATVCEAHGVDLPTAAVHFPLRHPAVVSVVVGAYTADQVRTNVNRFETPVPDALWDELESTGLIRSLDGARTTRTSTSWTRASW